MNRITRRGRAFAAATIALAAGLVTAARAGAASPTGEGRHDVLHGDIDPLTCNRAGRRMSEDANKGARMKRRLLVIGLVAIGLASVSSLPVASADPGTSNPQVQYRTFSCDDGNTYAASFVGFASGSFLLADSTRLFAIKVFTEYFPSGEVKTFNYGLPGFDPSSLVTCSYTDPEGVLNVFSGFFTPRS